MGIAFRVKRALPAVIRVAILLSFVPDVLRIFGVLPSGDMMSNPNFGAVDILAAPSGGATVDAANMWLHKVCRASSEDWSSLSQMCTGTRSGMCGRRIAGNVHFVC